MVDSLSNRFEVIPPFPTYIPTQFHPNKEGSNVIDIDQPFKGERKPSEWDNFECIEAKFKNPWRLMNPDLRETYWDGSELEELTLNQRERDLMELRKLTSGVVYNYDRLYELGDKDALKFSALRGDEAAAPVEDLDTE